MLLPISGHAEISLSTVLASPSAVCVVELLETEDDLFPLGSSAAAAAVVVVVVVVVVGVVLDCKYSTPTAKKERTLLIIHTHKLSISHLLLEIG